MTVELGQVRDMGLDLPHPSRRIKKWLQIEVKHMVRPEEPHLKTRKAFGDGVTMPTVARSRLPLPEFRLSRHFLASEAGFS